MGDGHLGKCKDCTRRGVEERRKRLESTDLEWALKEKKRMREKSAKTRANGTASPQSKESIKKWSQLNKHKIRAHDLVYKAVRSGKLLKLNCFCGLPANAHHEDYSKPLDVIWLCHAHHMELHAKKNDEALIKKFKDAKTF